VRPTRRVALLAVLTTLIGGLASLASPAAAWAVGGTFGTGTPEFAVSENAAYDNAGEPSIGVDWKSGAGLYMSGTSVLKLGFTPSTGVAMWSDVSPVFGITPNADPILATDAVSGTTLAGGDTGACSAMYASSDDGGSWLPSVPCTGVADHPMVAPAPSAVSPGSRVWYYCQQTALDNCATSYDDGLTWLPGANLSLDCTYQHGHLRAGPDGVAYLPSNNCFDADSTNLIGGLRTTDDGATWTGYTIPGAATPASGFDPAVAVTPDNTLYEAWDRVGDHHPVIALSHDQGATWGATVDLASTVSPPIVASTFASLVAGDSGRIAYSYLATQVGQPGADPFTTGFHGVWNLFTSYTYDGGATWTTVKDTETPVQYGEIDAGGTTTGGQRNLLDFMDSSLTKDGRVVVAFADGCLSDCETAADQSHAEALSTHATAAVAYQRAGKGLFASYDDVPVADPGPVCPGGRAGFADPAGDATEVFGNGAPLPSDPSLDLLDGSVDWDSATSAAVFRLRVTDLAAPPLVGQQSFRWLVTFSGDTKTYTLSALRGTTGAPTFGLSTTATDQVSIQGSFDNASNTVTLLLPSTLFQTFKAGNTALTGTRTVTVSQVFGDRTIDGLVVTSSGVADTAATTCNGTLAPPVTPPAAPVLSGSAHGLTVSLSWTTPANGGSPITGYQVLRGTSASSLSPLATTAGTTYDDTTGTAGQTYYYAVTATNEVGAGAASNTVSATPVTTPGTPTATATAGVGSVSLAWSTPSDGGSPVTGYVVERGTTSGLRSAVATLPAGTTSYTDSAVTAGTTYFYAVRATNAVGTGSASAEVSATPYTTAGAPALQALAGKGQVALSWTVPSDGGRPIQGYRIYRGTSSGGEVLVQTISTGTSYIDGGLTRGTKYWYRVAAFTAAGDGAPSNEVSATPK
jgi:fibronectin type 3 domain-containing protein